MTGRPQLAPTVLYDKLLDKSEFGHCNFLFISLSKLSYISIDNLYEVMVMELLFQEYELKHLERAWTYNAFGEQTVDVVVPDTYPDVDRILEAFGTLTIRDMECLSDSVSLSGTVQAGVLLVGENGELHSLPVSVPFGVRKELGSMIDNGIPRYQCELRSVDARLVNSRKLLVRVGYQWSFEIYTPCTRRVSYIEEPSERLQLRWAEYPLELPTVTGEKQFTVNEELELPDNVPGISVMLKWHTRLQITDQKTVGSKGVFKTELLLHLLYEDPQGKLCTHEWHIPLSQFVDLTGDAEGGEVRTVLHMTEWDLEPDNSVDSRRLFLRVGLRVNSMVYEVRRLRIIEDAYCTDSQMEPQWDKWQYRPLLDTHSLRGTAQWRGEEPLGTIVDLWASPGEGEQQRHGDTLSVRIPVSCSILYYDGEGKLRSLQIRPTMEGEVALHESGECALRDAVCTEVYCGGGTTPELRVPLQLRVDCFGDQSIRSLSGAELKPLPETGERVPSVILRRTAAEENLWTLAKTYRTSPKLIAQANALDDHPIPEGTMLLIPLS